MKVYELIQKLCENDSNDEPKLVRCRDCKFCKKYYHGAESNLGMITYECTRGGLYTVTADEFCSKAESVSSDL